MYREAVLEEPPKRSIPVDGDPHCLALLKYYRSLMQMAMTARKPMFFLKSADGAIGAHGEAVRSCYRDFERLASRVLAKAGIPFV